VVLRPLRRALSAPVVRPALVLVPAGGLLGALTVGVLVALGHVTGGPVLLLLGAMLLGEAMVLSGFAAMWSRAREDSRRPVAPGETRDGWLSALAALAPAVGTALLCVACFGLLLLLLALATAVGGAADQDLLHDGPLSGFLLFLLGTGLFLVPATVQAAVLGSVTGLLVRHSYLDRDRRELLAARESARTRAQAVAVQRTTTPGRGWRLLGRRAGLVLVGLGVLLIVTGRGVVGLLLVLAVSAVFVLRLWRGSRSPAIVSLRADLARRAGLPSKDDDAPLVAFRATELRAAAAARGWQPVAPTGGVVDQLVEQLTDRPTNRYGGTLDGIAFVCWDRLGVVTSSRQVDGAEVSTSRITGAATYVELDFPIVVRLAVVVGGPLAPVTWSHLGPRIDLESGEFNERFDVYCDDPVRARLVLNPAVMSLLLMTPQRAELLLDGGRLRLSAEDVLLTPDRIEEQVRLAARIRESARAAIPRLAD